MCRGLLQVDGAAASRSAAAASYLLNVFGEAVVYSQFLALLDIPKAHVENVAFADPGANIRFAAMIDQLGAATAYRAVDRPIVVERKQVRDRALPATLCLAPADSFASVLDDFLTGRDRFFGENSALMNAGFADPETVTAESWVDARMLDEASHEGFPAIVAKQGRVPQILLRYNRRTEGRTEKRC